MNFMAMDFETANFKRYSPCSLGIVVVRHNKITDELYSLIDPQLKFSWQCTKINGLRAKDVENAPTFPELWPKIKMFFTPNKLVTAHNASFDNSVVMQTLARYQIKLPKYQTIDTLQTSRKLCPNFPNYKLNTVCDDLGIKLNNHHNGLADSVACADILLAEQAKFGDKALAPFTKIVS